MIPDTQGMDVQLCEPSGFSLGAISVRGVDVPVVFLLADQFTIPETVATMLPIGGLGIPVVSCFADRDGLTAHLISADFTRIDTPWRVAFPPDLVEEIAVDVDGSAPRFALLVGNEDAPGSTIAVELSGSVLERCDTATSDEAVMFQVGLWLAATQLAAESGDGFGHTRVAARLAESSLFSADYLQRAISYALSSLTDDGRAKLASAALPRVVPQGVFREVTAGRAIRDLFREYGSAKTTVAAVWALAFLARLVVAKGSAHGHSVGTLLAEWVGGSNPWWMWRATSIAMNSYEDSIPVSVLESHSTGAVGPLFWWVHQLADDFRAMSVSEGRSRFIGHIRRSEVRPSDAGLPILDFSHILLADASGMDRTVFCGKTDCDSCAISQLVMRAPWGRSTVARCAVWSVLLISDVQAAQGGLLPGDEGWTLQRAGILSGFAQQVGNRVATGGRNAA